MKMTLSKKIFLAASFSLLAVPFTVAQNDTLEEGGVFVEDPMVMDENDTDMDELIDEETVTPAKIEIQRDNLVNNSPFRNTRFNPRATSNQPLELRGFAGSGPNMQISLTDARTRECQWVNLRDRNARWYVESVDIEARTAVVQMDGVSIALEFAKVNEQPLTTTSRFAPVAPQPQIQAQAQVPGQPQPQGGGNRGMQPGGQNGTSQPVGSWGPPQQQGQSGGQNGTVGQPQGSFQRDGRGGGGSAPSASPSTSWNRDSSGGNGSTIVRQSNGEGGATMGGGGEGRRRPN